jgi:hypothetical protein
VPLRVRHGLEEPFPHILVAPQNTSIGFPFDIAGPVPRNEYRLKASRREVLRMWWWQLRLAESTQPRSWERFQEKLRHLSPEVEIQHPYPEMRFASKYPNIQGKNRALGALATAGGGR